MKYIVVLSQGKERIFTFPNDINHDDMYDVIIRVKLREGVNNWYRLSGLSPKAVSAGFVGVDGVCYGYSETLKVASRQEQDTALWRKNGQ